MSCREGNHIFLSPHQSSDKSLQGLQQMMSTEQLRSIHTGGSTKRRDKRIERASGRRREISKRASAKVSGMQRR